MQESLEELGGLSSKIGFVEMLRAIKLKSRDFDILGSVISLHMQRPQYIKLHVAGCV